MNININNCHTHIFTTCHVPENFLPLGLVRFMTKYRLSRPLARVLNSVNPFSTNDLFDRYARFIEQGDQLSQEDILKGLMKSYPDDARFVVLSMDMDFMGAGAAQFDFLDQLMELAALKKTYDERVLPFICVDPRRPGILDLVKRFVEEHRFAGIKLYPPLGFYPFDERLFPVYDYAQQRSIPIIAHCSRGGIYYRGHIPDAWLIHPKTAQQLDRTGNATFTQHFTDPANYRYVLEQFKDLKICFAHFGGDDEWQLYEDEPDPAVYEASWFYKIRQLLKRWPNTYTDIAYTLADFDRLALLSVTLQEPDLRKRILFGSDFYMADQECSEFKFSIELRNRLGEEMYKQIAEQNSKKFLELK